MNLFYWVPFKYLIFFGFLKVKSEGYVVFWKFENDRSRLTKKYSKAATSHMFYRNPSVSRNLWKVKPTAKRIDK